MPELNQGPVSAVTGQTGATPDAGTGTIAPDPVEVGGQAGSQGSPTQGQAPSTQGVEDSFFDPKILSEKPELAPAYKQMQQAFTKKTQEIAKSRQKIEAYDAFMSDPVGQMQQIALQHGYSLNRSQAQQALNQQSAQDGGQDWQPNSWDDVFAKAEERAEQRIMQRFAPLLQNVREIKAESIEQKLDKIDPDWRLYEDEMRTNMGSHPTLINDIGKLYRLSVPEDVSTSRAVAEALKKLQSKTDAAHVGGKSTTSKTVSAPKEIKSFQDAVEEAKRILADRR
jgi:hypothetical protein